MAALPHIQKNKVSFAQLPQLDGLRAICLLSIIIHHWTVHYIKIEFPFEIGAFVFFALSGYLITRILLRGKEKIALGKTSFSLLIKTFTIRRVLRLLPGYYLALALYVILLSPDVLQNFLWYVTNSTNIHFALMGKWAGGADQFWTLAVDQQFYAILPFIVLLVPNRFLPFVFILIAGLSPFSRFMTYFDHPLFTGPKHDKLPWFLTDHLCFGALLAYLHEKGKMPRRVFLWVSLVISLILFVMMRYHLFIFDSAGKLLIWQQTLLATFSTCLVGLCIKGIGGLGRAILEHPVIQYIGKRSYGYYLYHNLAFLLLGKTFFFLFPDEGSPDPFFILRIILASVILYFMTHYSWKYVEEPLMRRKEKHRYQKAN